MHRWSAAPFRRSIVALLTLALLSSALAASLAVHPFRSDDALLGVAIADEIAASFHDSAVVLGPEIAAGLVPPLVVVDGFVNLGRVLPPEEWTGPSGPQLVRSGTGVDVVVSGELELYDDRAVLRLELASAAGTQRAELSAPHDRRERLVGQAVRLVAAQLGLERAPTPVASPPLEGAYAEHARAVALAATGLVPDAASTLEQAAAEGDGELPARAAELAEDLERVRAGGQLAEVDAADELAAARRLARRAFLSLSLPTLHESGAADAFAALAELGGPPVAHAWRGVLAADMGSPDAAASAFEAARAAGDYPFAAALMASLLQAEGELDAAFELVDALLARGPEAGASPLLGASIVAFLGEDDERQVASLQALARAAPFLAYPFQELSFIAFDQDDALAAAEALAVAVELQPGSSLYWTNLGWARYLLGFLDDSEAASQRALELDANQYIAAYNLGLVRAVTGRLGAALDAYDYAVALDPAVDDEVIVDLIDARELYPHEPAVEYALARLYEAKGQRQLAREAYQRFLDLAADAGDDTAAYLDQARERVTVLSAPPPPLEILGAVSLGLGHRGPDVAPYHPGDPLYATFELSTPGEQLPTLVEVELVLRPADGEGEPLAAAAARVEPPAGAVGYVVDGLNLELPADLPAGDYRLAVEARADEGLHASGETLVSVAGDPDPVRQLFGRNVVMTTLEVELPLVGRADVARTGLVLERMLAELHGAADIAEQALPMVEDGRFAGMGGRELFSSSTAADVLDYLTYLVASGTADTRFTFVDGYAQWAVDGAPATP